MIESSRHVKTEVPGNRYWFRASTPYFTESLLTCRAGSTRSSSSRLTRFVAIDTPPEGFPSLARQPLMFTLFSTFDNYGFQPAVFQPAVFQTRRRPPPRVIRRLDTPSAILPAALQPPRRRLFRAVDALALACVA